MAQNLSWPKTILVAVDGSDSGYRAADFAIGLATKLGSEVLILYVIGASSADPDYRIPANMVEAFEDMGKEVLGKCEARAKNSGTKFNEILVTGDPVSEILRQAEDKKVDCIVMGKRGLGRLEKLLMGSVSTKVSNLSEIPVILVK
ncbi:MAG: universal stress protein [Nitrososphaerota archaeon]|nr:universal stress protein [Nitrososphaerota archaeon]